MAITFGKGVKKLLNKVQARHHEVAPPPPPAKPTVTPTKSNPDESLLAALWALPGRPGRTLHMIRRRDGKKYQVHNYNPVTREITLFYPGFYDKEHTFTTTMTGKVETEYAVKWT